MAVDRVAFVTGGAGGIGSAICHALAADGWKVAAADLVASAAQDVADELEGIGIELDVCDPVSVDTALEETTERLGAPSALVNCAGWDELKPFLDTDDTFSAKVLEINLAGPIRLTRAVLPAMVEQNWGRIINIASDAGRVGSSMEAVYSGAKGGLIAFTKTIAREFAKKGVTANTVCPGPTDTGLLRSITAANENADRLITSMTNAVPMRRLGRPEDLAPAVAYLASEGAGYVTGQTLSVSGGLTMA